MNSLLTNMKLSSKENLILLTLDLPHANQSLTFDKSLKQVSLSSKSSLHKHHSSQVLLITNISLMHIALLSTKPLMYKSISSKLRSHAKQSLRHSVNQPYKIVSSYHLAHQTLRPDNSAKPNSHAYYSNSHASALRPQTLRHHIGINNMTANTLCYSGD